MSAYDDLANDEGSSMAPTPSDEGAVLLPRVSLDFKIPLWSLVMAAALGLGSLIAMYYRLDQVGKDVVELQATVRAVNTSTLQFAQEQAVLKFRVDKIEELQARKDR